MQEEIVLPTLTVMLTRTVTGNPQRRIFLTILSYTNSCKRTGMYAMHHLVCTHARRVKFKCKIPFSSSFPSSISSSFFFSLLLFFFLSFFLIYLFHVLFASPFFSCSALHADVPHFSHCECVYVMCNIQLWRKSGGRHWYWLWLLVSWRNT